MGVGVGEKQLHRVGQAGSEEIQKMVVRILLPKVTGNLLVATRNFLPFGRFLVKREKKLQIL